MGDPNFEVAQDESRLSKRMVSGVLKDKQAGSGLHKLGQQYTPALCGLHRLKAHVGFIEEE